MKNALYYLIIMLIVLLFSGCNNCKKTACPGLTTEEISWFPYAEFDTLVFNNSENDSILYFPINRLVTWADPNPSNRNDCGNHCIAGMEVNSNCLIGTVEIFNCVFVIHRTSENFYVVISPYGGALFSNPSSYSYFDIRDATALDNLNTNGNLLEDVHHYTCKPQQEEVAETYVKKGVGLVKIVFRDGQEFELVEHIRAD